ncbi:MAG: type IV pilus twitching motility protein PilT [Candidatus Hydrogenedentota bacterium]
MNVQYDGYDDYTKEGQTTYYSSHQMHYDMLELMQLCYDRNASDIHVAVNTPPVLRIDGHLEPLDGPPLTPADTERLVKQITSEIYLQKIAEVGAADFAYAFGDIARFRVSAFRQKGLYQGCLRLIPQTLMSWEQLGLPQMIKDLLYLPRGLIVVTGPTGSGKTTTLASMVDYINTERDCHIVTIEDPIEFYHHHKKSIVTQRELGVDTPSFATALKHVLRQNPDIILVGEMRDLETIQAAITAAETGHLVFATLHTSTAPGTINRVIDAFPMDQQAQIRTQLSVSLVAVICQTLLPRIKGGRCAAFEILVATDAVKAMIRDNKIPNIVSAIQTGQKLGMQTLEQGLFNLYQRGWVSYQDAIRKAQRPDEFEKLVKGD